MRLALLHRRLMGMMALAVLGALVAGAGVTTAPLVTAAAVAFGFFRRADPGFGAAVGRISQVLAVGIFAWVLYVGLLVGGDVLDSSLVLLFVLLVGESLRPIEDRNDFRVYSLTFAILIAATAFYPGIGFGFAFTAYVVLVTLALMVGHLRHQAEVFRISDIRIGRSFLVNTAVLSVITLFTSAAIFLAFPRLPRSWFGQGRAAAGTFAGFGDEVSLGEHGGRLRGNPEVMFRVEFPGEEPSEREERYWRGLSFDRFDGTRWSRTIDGPGRPMYFPPFPYHLRWGGAESEYRIFGGPPGVQVLFGQHPVVRVRPHSAIRPRFHANGDLLYDGADAPVYTVQSGPALPSEAQLRSGSGGPPPEGGTYLQLPRLDDRVHRLADSLTRAHAARIDRVRAVERWLLDEFRYTLDLPRTSREATLEHFLFERRAGHCEYFSTAMAVLLRSAGIPTRNVNGFLGGEWNARGGYLAVTGNNAHSWVEVWFPELGWVPFDPTPAAEREEVLLAAGSSAVWPVLFWFDGVQFQWYRWVLAYDLDRQMDLVRVIGQRLDIGPGVERRGAPIRWREVLVWVLGASAAAFLWWVVGRRRREPYGRETRLYLALRRSYESAGYPTRPADPPLAFTARLRSAEAPAVGDAEWVVSRYLRARFAGEPLDREEQAAMEHRLEAIRGALSRPRSAPHRQKR
jgi:transglutaminase-like putative cysteine protease